MMLDRKSVKFLRYLRAQPKKSLKWGYRVPQFCQCSRAEFFAMLDFLEAEDYITAVRDDHNNRTGAKLAYKGLHPGVYSLRAVVGWLGEHIVEIAEKLLTAVIR